MGRFQGFIVGPDATQHNTFQAPSGRPPHEVPAPRGMHNLPPASAVFVGRDLAQFDALLGQNASGVVVGQVAVHGLGGIGKTELVIHYAHAVRGRYPLAWWITADSPDSIGRGLARLASRLQSTVAVAHAQEWAIGWLQSHPEWLLVLDNVEDIADIRPLLGQLAGCGHVLVTTRRDPTSDGWAPLGLAPLRLEPLGRPASVELLVRLTGHDDAAGADALADDLGDLPLALEQAAAYISRHRGMDYHGYREVLATRFDRVAHHGGRGGDTERTMGLIWRVTMETITDRSPLARAVLDVLAWLAPEALPEDVLHPLAADPDDVLDAIALLADHNMIRWQDRTVSVHRLVQSVTRAVHPDPHHRKTGPATLAVRLLAAAAPTGDPWNDVADWPRWSQLLPHADALYAAVPEERRDAALLGIAHSAAAFRRGQGHLAAAITLYEQVLADRRRVLGGKHLDTLETRFLLAHGYREAGRVAEAIAVFERIIADARWRRRGGSLRLSARHGLAIAYECAGRVEAAITLYEQVLNDSCRQWGENDAGVMSIRHNLALAYQNVGRIDDAVTLFETVLADAPRVLGETHPHTLNTRHCLGCAYQQAGRVTEAVDLLEAVLADTRDALGAHHPITLNIRHSLAQVFKRAGRVDEALDLSTTVLADQRRVLGDDHPDTLDTRHALAVFSLSAGRTGEATAMHEAVLADRRRVLGDDNPDTLTSRHALADAYRTAGRTAEAVALFEEVLADRIRILGEDHPDTKRTAKRLTRDRSGRRTPPAAPGPAPPV